MTARDDLTRQILEQLPEQHRVEFDRAIMSWWANLRRGGGYRLTDEGFRVLADVLDLEHWTMELPPINPHLLIELERKLQSPYHVTVKKRQLKLFNSRDAVMANLHGDIRRWLELIQKRGA